MNEQAKANAGYSMIAGIVLTLFGWFAAMVGTSEQQWYNISVDFFWWTLRIGGLCLIAAAGITMAGVRHGVLLDAIVSFFCGAVMVLCPVAWMTQEGMHIQYIIYGIFGAIIFDSGRKSLKVYRDLLATPTPRGMPAIVEPDPVHPASIRPSSFPAEGEPPPADGYLSALAREDDDPPNGAYK